MAHGFTTDGGWLIDRLGRPTLLRGVNLEWRHQGAGHARRRDPPRGVGFDGWAEVSLVGRRAPDGRARSPPRPHRRVGHELPAAPHDLGGHRARRPRRARRALPRLLRRGGASSRRPGLWVFVDPHQDVWSRWTGGDGAPFWCFELAGLAPERFVAAEAVALDTGLARNYQAGARGDDVDAVLRRGHVLSRADRRAGEVAGPVHRCRGRAGRTHRAPGQRARLRHAQRARQRLHRAERAVDDVRVADLRPGRPGTVEPPRVPGGGGRDAGEARGRRGPQPRRRLRLARRLSLAAGRGVGRGRRRPAGPGRPGALRRA